MAPRPAEPLRSLLLSAQRFPSRAGEEAGPRRAGKAVTSQSRGHQELLVQPLGWRQCRDRCAGCLGSWGWPRPIANSAGKGGGLQPPLQPPAPSPAQTPLCLPAEFPWPSASHTDHKHRGSGLIPRGGKSSCHQELPQSPGTVSGARGPASGLPGPPEAGAARRRRR